AAQVGALPDPSLTYRYFIEEVETRVGAQRQAVALAQRFPWLGKLPLRAGAAADAADAERQRYEARKLALFYAVKEAYYEYYYLRRAVATVEENMQLLRNSEQIARTRYSALAAGHPDVLRIQVELGRLDDQLRTLKDLRGPISARLNAAMNRPVEDVLPWPQAIEDRDAAVSQGPLLASLEQSNPELKALGHEISESRRRVDLAKKDYFPDVTLGVDYIQTAPSTHGRHPADDGKDPVIAMVSVNLPIWRDKLAAGLREARHRHIAAVRRRKQKANSLSAELKLVLYRYRDAERKIGLYRDTLLPKARQGFTAAQVAFQAGKASFTDLVDAQRALLEFQLAFERALSNKAQRLAELEMLTGREVPRAATGKPPAAASTNGGGTIRADEET
ncbi:MAG: TolC family protein, partial [Phycisphaerae bacterium]